MNPTRGGGALCSRVIALLGDTPFLSYEAIFKLTQEYEFETVLDLGAGKGLHSKRFLEKGKKVTAINAYGEMHKNIKDKLDLIIADYLEYNFDEKFDCIWASHILEHQRNVGIFLDKCYDDLKDNGIFAVTVPPSEMLAGYGHGNCFTKGHLIYHLLAAGFDLSDMRLKEYNRNLSVICRRRGNVKNRPSYFEIFESFKDRMPKYLLDAIEDYKREHSGYERITNNIQYNW